MSIPNSVTTIGNSAFEGCTGLTSIAIPDNVETISSSTFEGCTSLASVSFGDRITAIGGSAFRKTAITEVLLPQTVTSVGGSAFADCDNIIKVYSLNTTPPVIYSSTFDSKVEAEATLHVQKGSLVHYWLDPVWKEFTNMADDVLCLQAIPDASYGDPEIDLAAYAPAGVELTYETSNDDVVRINGTKMQIVGAGTATVGALLADQGSQMEFMGQMRTFNVEQAPVTISVQAIEIQEGMPIPDFSFVADGLVYDDTIDDIAELPVAVCEATDDSAVGEYPITLEGGHDRNYAISTRPSVLKIIKKNGSIETVVADSESDIEVFDLSGVPVYKGPKKDAHLTKGIYIIRQGHIATKIFVK